MIIKIKIQNKKFKKKYVGSKMIISYQKITIPNANTIKLMVF